MLRVTPIPELEKKVEYTSLCGCECDLNALTYSICEDEEKIGVCQFKLTNEGGVIISLRTKPDYNDLGALIIAGRAALFFMERQGMKNAVLLDRNEKLERHLHFKDGKVDLVGYFDGPCEGSKINQ